MQGCLTKLRILFHCLLDGGQFKLSRGLLPAARNGGFFHGREKPGEMEAIWNFLHLLSALYRPLLWLSAQVLACGAW